MASETRQRVLVTGASSGIGRATAIALARAGMDIALLSRSQAVLETLAHDLVQLGVEAKAYPVDLAQTEALTASLQTLMEDFGPISALVNNAGMGYTGALADMPLPDWQRLVNLNLTSALLTIQAVLPGMRTCGRGTIINIASIAAHNSFPEWGAYSATKAALVSLSRVLAAEERRHGIRVMIISPGAVNTALWDTETVQADFERSQMLTPDIVAQAITNAIQLPEAAVIDEITLMPSGGAL